MIEVAQETALLHQAFVTAGDTADRPAAEALAAAMEGWSRDELASYRHAVATALGDLNGGPVSGFLAVEVLALIWANGQTA